MYTKGTPLLVILVVYALAAAWLLPLTRWQINPDGLSYILIARRVLALDFYGSVNAHWSPLFSWMLVPFLAGHVEALLACKLLTYSIGAAALVAIWLLTPMFTDGQARQTMVTAAFAPSVLVWASSLITPDLLLVCILLFYLGFVFRPESTSGVQTTIVGGLLGGLAYFAKSYALPFVAAHFTVVHVLRWRAAESSDRKKEVVRRFIAGMCPFLLIALSWIAILSLKYGYPTSGAAGPYSWHVIGPLSKGEHPVHTQGLLRPPDAHALSIWDDPSRVQLPPWPVEMASVGYLARLITGNAVRLIGIIESWSLLALPIIAVAVYRVARRNGTRSQHTVVRWTLITGVLFGCGFLPLLLEARYVWILNALLLLIAPAVVDDIKESFAMTQKGARILLAVVMVSLVVRPLLPRRIPEEGRVARQEADDLAMRGVDLRGRRLASNRHWESTLYLNYNLGARYYGTPKPNQDSAEIRRELDRHGIDAFIVWGAPRPAYLGQFRLVAVSPHAFALYER